MKRSLIVLIVLVLGVGAYAQNQEGRGGRGAAAPAPAAQGGGGRGPSPEQQAALVGGQLGVGDGLAQGLGERHGQTISVPAASPQAIARVRAGKPTR